MKLRNKLIPLMSAATVAATIAPVALTSCSAGMVSLLNGYRPTIKKAVWEDFKSNKKDMLAFYMSAVNENPEIFAQDIYWKYATESYYDAESEGGSYSLSKKITDLQAKVSNVKINKITCDYTSEGKRQTIDYYTINMDFTFKYGSEHFTDYYYDVDNWDMTISVKNIPLTINRGDINVYYDWDYSYIGIFEGSFYYGFLPTSWIIQPMGDIVFNETTGYPEIDYSSYTNLENNGYDWFVNIQMNGEETKTSYKTREPETTTKNVKLEFNKTSQFEKAQKALEKYWDGEQPQSLELVCAEYIYKFYLPSFYLSDILDENNQLWKEGE